MLCEIFVEYRERPIGEPRLVLARPEIGNEFIVFCVVEASETGEIAYELAEHALFGLLEGQRDDLWLVLGRPVEVV